MKSLYIKSLVFLGGALMLSACNDNSWNNTFLDGFDGQPTYDNSVTVEYTLSSSDYEAIGKMLYNQAQTAEEKAAANAIQSNHYFDQNSPYNAQTAVPYLLNQVPSDFYIYNDGSTVNVTLNLAETPEEIVAVNSAHRLVLESAPAASSIPSTLLSEYPDAQAGDIAIVSYPDKSYVSPVMAAAPQSKTIARQAATRAGVDLTSNIKNLSDGVSLTATAVVTAQSTRGLILTDNAGSIFYYNNNVDLSTYAIGTVVNVSGTVGVYGTGFQLSASATLSVAGTESYTYPTPKVYSGSMVDAAAASSTPSTAEYVSLTGELSISGNYYNIIIPGATAQGSLYTPVDALKNKLVDGQTYTFTGYFTGVTSGKYFYMVITELDGEGAGSGGGDNSGSGGNGGGSTDTPSGEYWTVSEALSKIENGYSGAATVEGYIISITEISTSYGNATYVIADSPTATEGLIVYRGYYFNGEKFTSESQLEVGALVVVSGDLVNYNGTFEFTTGSQIVSYNGEGAGAAFDESIAVNQVYQFDGASWALASDLIALNGADYTALGLTPNSLSNPAVYLPIYMKDAYPYTTAGTEMYVAYNVGNLSSSCALMTYDGANWTYVNNFVETKVAAFTKSSGSYSFRKFIGEEVFNYYDGDKIALNCSYMIVWGGLAMDPVPTGKTYGYPGETPVTIADGSIVMPNGDNAFTFTTTTEYNGNTYTTPEGYFLILDSNGRYMYLQGTYSSFNVRSNNAYIESDGTISIQYLFKATKEEDGTWRIVNEQPDITRTLYYSDGNNDFAAYTDEQLERYVGRLPYLYISETSTPVADDTVTE